MSGSARSADVADASDARFDATADVPLGGCVAQAAKSKAERPAVPDKRSERIVMIVIQDLSIIHRSWQPAGDLRE
jgi:hypothetical protein